MKFIRDTQSELIGALVEFIKSSKKFIKISKRKQLIIRMRTSVTCVEHKEPMYKGISRAPRGHRQQEVPY